MQTNAEIRRPVLRELEWDTRVDGAEVESKSTAASSRSPEPVNGWATRVAAQEAAHRGAGVVDGEAAGKRAAESASGTAGVQSVEDHLQIKPYAARE